MDYLNDESFLITCRWEEFELRPFAVECIVCGHKDEASESQLMQAGWNLGRLEYCPTHANPKHWSIAYADKCDPDFEMWVQNTEKTLQENPAAFDPAKPIELDNLPF